jgi:hypothetical protein
MEVAMTRPETEALLRKLTGPNAFLEPDTGCPGRWLIAGRPGRRGVVDESLVRALEKAGLLMAMPDGRLVPAAPARRRHLVQTTITAENGERIAVTMNTAESPLGWLIRRRGPDGAPEFDTPLIAAAERLRQDYTRAQMEPRLTAALDGFVASGARGRSGPGTFDPPLAALAAKERFFAALDAVGPELSGILAEICCLTAGLEQAERSLSLPARSGKAILHLALTRLARHYGFLSPERPCARHRAIRNWRQSKTVTGSGLR